MAHRWLLTTTQSLAMCDLLPYFHVPSSVVRWCRITSVSWPQPLLATVKNEPCPGRNQDSCVSELEREIWLALQSCRWSPSFKTETLELCFARNLVFHLSRWGDYYFSSLEIRILANFWLPKNKLQLLSFLICLQYCSSFLTLII